MMAHLMVAWSTLSLCLPHWYETKRSTLCCFQLPEILEGYRLDDELSRFGSDPGFSFFWLSTDETIPLAAKIFQSLGDEAAFLRASSEAASCGRLVLTG